MPLTWGEHHGDWWAGWSKQCSEEEGRALPKLCLLRTQKIKSIQLPAFSLCVMAVCSFFCVSKINYSKNRQSGAVTGKLAYALAVDVGNWTPAIVVFNPQKCYEHLMKHLTVLFTLTFCSPKWLCKLHVIISLFRYRNWEVKGFIPLLPFQYSASLNSPFLAFSALLGSYFPKSLDILH